MESATLHYQALINFCFLLPFAQILAETPPLSIHDSPFLADHQDTVGTFKAPPDPTGKVSFPLALPPPPPPPPAKFPASPIIDVTKPIGD